eukprot:jgi/Chrzof1/10316/Cz04g37070.t1
MDNLMRLGCPSWQLHLKMLLTYDTYASSRIDPQQQTHPVTASPAHHMPKYNLQMSGQSVTKAQPLSLPILMTPSLALQPGAQSLLPVICECTFHLDQLLLNI